MKNYPVKPHGIYFEKYLRQIPKLKPCPFCGNKKMTADVLNPNCCVPIGIVMCSDCGARVCAPSKEGAIVKWNRRVITKGVSHGLPSSRVN